MSTEKSIVHQIPLTYSDGKREVDGTELFHLLYDTFLLLKDHIEGKREPVVTWANPKARFLREVEIDWNALGDRAADPAAWPTLDQAEIFSAIERVPVTIKQTLGDLINGDGNSFPKASPPPRTYYLNEFNQIDIKKNSYWAYQPCDGAEEEVMALYVIRTFTHDIVRIINEEQNTLTSIKGLHGKGKSIEYYRLPDSLMQLSIRELAQKTTFGAEGVEIPDDYIERILAEAPGAIREMAKERDYSEYEARGEIHPGLSWSQYMRINNEGTVNQYILREIRDRHRDARRLIGWKTIEGEDNYDPLLEIIHGDASLFFNVLPLTIDIQKKSAYYPLSLSFKLPAGQNPELWTETEKHAFWTGFLTEIKKHLPKGQKTPEIPIAHEIKIAIPAVVKMDRGTEQDLLPAMLHKGIFTNYASLDAAEDILEREAKKIGKEDRTQLTTEEQRAALTRAREYRDGAYVWRDYGDHRLGFSARLYLEYLNLTEEALREKAQAPSLFEDDNKRVAEALKRVRLYTIANDLAHAVLSEAYDNKKVKGIQIPTAKLLVYLGRPAGDPNIYEDIRDAMFSLRFVDYQHQEFNYTKEGKISRRRGGLKSETVGNFLYNVTQAGDSYIVDVNEKFIGCVAYLWGEKHPKAERRGLFARGYFDYIPRQISHSYIQGYSYHAKQYLGFLLHQAGNKRLNDKEHKIIAIPLRKHIEGAQIKGKRGNDAFRIFVGALQEISQVIHKTEPTVSELQAIPRPSKVLDDTLRVWILKDPKGIDALMQALDDKKRGS